jgi:hypothetical protein
MKLVSGVVGVVAMLCLLAFLIARGVEMKAQNELDSYRDQLVCEEASRFDKSIACPQS